MRKKRINPDLEAEILIKHGGVIDLKKLWAKDSEVEADPKKINSLINASKVRPTVQS